MNREILAAVSICKYIKKRVEDELPDQEFGIPHIKQATAECVVLFSNYWERQERILPLNEQETKRLQNLAVAVFLRYWLYNDINARVKISDYVQYGFTLQNEKKKANMHNDFFSQERNLRNHINNKMQIFNELKRQAQEERRPYTPIADGIPKKYVFPFETMAYFDLSAQGYLSLEDLAFKRQEILKSTAEKKSNTALIRAYSNLINLLKYLDTDYAGKIKAPLSCRQYVAYCMFLHGWECANRFMLAANVAQHLGEKDLVTIIDDTKTLEKNPIFCKAAYFFGRFLVSDNSLFKGKLNSQYNQEDYPYDILCYTPALNAIFADEAVENLSILVRENYLRTLFADTLSVLTCIYPFNTARSWTDKDFYDAAEFFHNDYPIVKTCLDIEFPPGDGKFYDNCRAFYVMMGKMNHSPIAEAREKLAKKGKNKSGKKSGP